MMIELGKFGKGSFEFKTEELGIYKIASLGFNVRIQVIEKIDSEFSTSSNLTIYLITQLAHKSVKPNEVLISASEIKRLKESDLNSFAEKFVENNIFLLSGLNDEKDSENKADENLNLSKSIKEFEKNKDENSQDYLIRFFKTYMQLQYESAKKQIVNLSSLYTDSSTIKSLLNQNFEITSSMKPFLDSLQPSSDFIFPISKSQSEITNEKLNDLASTILKLSETSNRSFSLFTNMNNIILNLLAEAKKSSKSSSIFNYIMISIGVISLLLTTVFSYQSLQSSNRANEELKIVLNKLIINSDHQSKLFNDWLDRTYILKYAESENKISNSNQDSVMDNKNYKFK